jgi:hypothetical protein
MLERFPNHLWLYYSVVGKKKVEKVEAELLAAFLPPFNREFPATVANAVRGLFA